MDGGCDWSGEKIGSTEDGGLTRLDMLGSLYVELVPIDGDGQMKDSD